jgi:hypothetical protein
MAEKRSKGQLYKYIIDVLASGPYNIHQITEKLKENKVLVSWEAVSSALNILTSIDYVKKDTASGREVFLLNASRDFSQKTILGLPISKEDEALCCSLANRFRELKPGVNNTFLQKMLVELIKKKNLNIPYGWYLYGECCVVRLNGLSLSNYQSTKKYDPDIKQIIADFAKYQNTNVLMHEKYASENNHLYLHRLKIDNMLAKPFEKRSDLELLDLEIKHLIWSFKEDPVNKPILTYLLDFYSIFCRISKLKIEEVEALRLEIFTCFKSVWEMIGTYQMYESTKRFYKQNTLPNFQYAYHQLKNVAEEHLWHLFEHCPPIYISPEMQAFRDSLAKRS